MNRLTRKIGTNKVVLGAVIASVALLCVLALIIGPSFAKAADSPEKRAAIQARELEFKEVASAFPGYVDICLDVQNKQPFLADVQVKGIVRAAGSTFIRFQHRNGESWCIDADKIIAYRVRRK